MGDGRQQRRRVPWAAAAVLVACLLGQPALADEGRRPARRVARPRRQGDDGQGTVTIDLRNVTPDQGSYYYFFNAFAVPVPAGAENVRARSGGSTLQVSFREPTTPRPDWRGSPSPTCSTGARNIVLTFDVPGEKPRSADRRASARGTRPSPFTASGMPVATPSRSSPRPR